MKKVRILMRLYDVTPTILLRRNLFKHYNITWTLDYAVTSFKLARWKVRFSSLRHKPLKDMGDDIDISSLTIEQYLDFIQDNNRSSIVKPKTGDYVEFEINNNFMRELRRKLFAGTDDEDAHKHGRALRWKKRLPAGVINTWDLLEKVFIWKYCSPFKTAKKLEEILNFKQEIDKTLYHASERYIDLLYRCLHYDLNGQQKVHIFYTGLDISTRKMLDSRGFITLMTPTQSLISIQVMIDYSHNWYDETTTKEKINDRPDNVDAIQESFKEAHPTKECPLKKEDKAARTTMGKENMKKPIPRDLPPMPFPGNLKEQIGSPYKTRKTVCMIENPREVHKKKAWEDEGGMDTGWDITEKIVREVEHDYDIPPHSGVVQPLTPRTVHITPPDDDYVAPATNLILDK
uniref:Retrotransposon gag domain-containing protein n=1 Tax=Tanacetum cinerariifolium TaxID=118510 RepID=A0A6L2MJ66_TANCI|nr:hypothetical protein [Tanacetum cinerariifolium]